jgi:uncharacterized membrane protein YGL010W
LLGAFELGQFNEQLPRTPSHRTQAYNSHDSKETGHAARQPQLGRLDNRVCHFFGIPMIVLSLALGLAAIFFHRLGMIALSLFLLGWMLQFIGHAFEGKWPEFFHDWRFLFVGTRWWADKVLHRGTR